MLTKAARLLRRPKTWLVLAIVAAVALNGLAFMHARTMTRFIPSGERTNFPEKLSVAQKVGVLFTGVTLPHPRNDRGPSAVGLAHQDVRLRAKDGIGLSAWHIPKESPRIVIAMHHGYAGCRATLLDEAKVLHEMGCALYLADFRGCGDSDGDRTTIGVEEAMDVVATLEEARRQYPHSKVVQLGQSMGAAAILRAIHSHGTKPDGIILEAPFNRLLSTIAHRFEVMNLPSFPFAHLLVYWGGRSIGIDGFSHNPVEYAAAVSCPAMVMNGDLDRRVSVQEATDVYGALPAWKRIKIFQGAGHLLYTKKHVAEWKAEINDLLDRVLRSNSP